MEIENRDNPKIVKNIIHAGSQAVPFQPGTKVTFHFQTRLADDPNILIDDSRKWNKPMELVLGRKFKLPVWEVIVKNMALNEVAKFVVDKSLVEDYSTVSKVYRDAAQNKPAQRHHCHASLIAGGLGYEDLNELFKSPQNLEFIFELIKVEQPGQYEKEMWQFTEENKREIIPQLKQEGNQLYQNKEYKRAIEKYALALKFIEQLQLREKPRDTEWNELDSMKLPFHLNLAQCQMCVNDFYAAIENCNLALQNDSNNVKALFRRGKAQLKVWNLKEAKEDLTKVLELDPSQKSAVLSLMQNIKEAENESKNLEKSIMKMKFF